MAFPFTIPSAVGNYDIKGQPRWRRPDVEHVDYRIALLEARTEELPRWYPRQGQKAAAEVDIFDIVHGLSQRVEAQFQRDWSFLPSIWNVLFRTRVNTGQGLALRSRAGDDPPDCGREQDAAAAAAKCLKLLNTGSYVTQGGKRRRIDGDVAKLEYAEGLTRTERHLLRDMRFRTRSIPGTQEVRRMMGHLGFWASVVYGSQTFMTISLSERHNYLAVRLARYRRNDPYMEKPASDCEAAGARRHERDWMGWNEPSLCPGDVDTLELDIPGYDLWKLMLSSYNVLLLARAPHIFVNIPGRHC